MTAPPLSNTSETALQIGGLSYAYADRAALRNVDFEVRRGEILALLGRNGSGKTTLFRLLATLMPLQQGQVSVLGEDLRSAAPSIRRWLGVVFQSPSLDKKLTVAENIRCQAALYGLRGAAYQSWRQELLERLGLTGRTRDFVASLSGGLRRRVELVKALLHRPQLLLMDEPSTGLDPEARLVFGQCVAQLCDAWGVTVLLTTHLLDEAERADRVGILDAGQMVSVGSPDALKREAGGEVLGIETANPNAVAETVRQLTGQQPQIIGRQVRLESSDARRWLGPLVDALPSDIASITLAKPTLEDVFLRRTGHSFFDQETHLGRDS